MMKWSEYSDFEQEEILFKILISWLIFIVALTITGILFGTPKIIV